MGEVLETSNRLSILTVFKGQIQSFIHYVIIHYVIFNIVF